MCGIAYIATAKNAVHDLNDIQNISTAITVNVCSFSCTFISKLTAENYVYDLNDI
jgi:hypothetical protein